MRSITVFYSVLLVSGISLEAMHNGNQLRKDSGQFIQLSRKSSDAGKNSPRRSSASQTPADMSPREQALIKKKLSDEGLKK